MADAPDQIAREAAGFRAQAKRAIARLMGPHVMFTRLFRTADGALKDEAAEFLDWLARRTFLDEPTWDADPRAHAFNEGRRSLALEILAGLRLDHRKLAALRQQLKENDDD